MWAAPAAHFAKSRQEVSMLARFFGVAAVVVCCISVRTVTTFTTTVEPPVFAENKRK
jgi:hypothetical protein